MSPDQVTGQPLAPPTGSGLMARWGALGGASCGVVAGVMGGALGLSAYPPTAWFAVLELGVPAALLGVVVGLSAGAVVGVVKRISRASAPTPVQPRHVRPPDRPVAVIVGTATLVLGVAVLGLPWGAIAGDPNIARTFTSGSAGGLTPVIGAAMLACVLASWPVKRRRTAHRAALAVAALATMLLATRLAATCQAEAARSLQGAVLSDTPSRATFGIGALLGVGAAIVMAIASVWGLFAHAARRQLRLFERPSFPNPG